MSIGLNISFDRLPRIINLERYHKISKSESVEKYLNSHVMLSEDFLVTEQVFDSFLFAAVMKE